MTTDHLTPEQEAEAPLFFGDGGSGWGFGVGVVARRDDVSATPGRFGWAGGYGTFRLDMERRLALAAGARRSERPRSRVVAVRAPGATLPLGAATQALRLVGQVHARLVRRVDRNRYEKTSKLTLIGGTLT